MYGGRSVIDFSGSGYGKVARPSDYYTQPVITNKPYNMTAHVTDVYCLLI
jgi:hypothetical protein